MADFAFDAVLFDIESTQVTYDPYWPDVARTATTRLFERLGLEREIPTTAAWMPFRGRPVSEAVEATFAFLGAAELSEAQATFAEEMWVARGQGPAFRVGVESAFGALKERGVELGVMQDSGPMEHEAAMIVFELSRWIDESRCHPTDHVSNKTILIEEVVEAIGTRSAVVVGSTREDRDAAWANALPYVHVPRDHETLRLGLEAEATLDGLDQLPSTLASRDAILRDVLDRVSGARTVGLSGPALVGKTLAARDLARLARASGLRADAMEGLPGDLSSVDVELLFVVEREPTSDEGHAPFDANIRLVADERVLERRARVGRQGSRWNGLAGEPVVRPRADAALLDDALVVDMTNPIFPRIG